MNNVKTALLILLTMCSQQHSVAQSSVSDLSKSTQNAGTASRQQPQASSTARPEDESADEVLHVETTLITVPVSVSDRTGKFIVGLRQEDFRVYENGAEQPIAYFAPVEQPFTVFLLLDTSGSTDVHLKDIQEAAVVFIDQLRPQDQVVIATFDDQVQVLGKATSDRSVLRAAIRGTRTGGGTRLYDTMNVLVNRVLNRIPGRKAVVLFTDGWDTNSRATSKSNIRDVEETDLIVYPIKYDARQFFGDKSDRLGRITSIERNGVDILFEAEDYLKKLANKTGGRLYRAEKMENVSQAFASIAEELRRQYSLGYYLKTLAKPGDRRRIKVRVNRKNVAVKAREEYLVADQATKQSNSIR